MNDLNEKEGHKADKYGRQGIFIMVAIVVGAALLSPFSERVWAWNTVFMIPAMCGAILGWLVGLVIWLCRHKQGRDHLKSRITNLSELPKSTILKSLGVIVFLCYAWIVILYSPATVFKAQMRILLVVLVVFFLSSIRFARNVTKLYRDEGR